MGKIILVEIKNRPEITKTLNNSLEGGDSENKEKGSGEGKQLALNSAGRLAGAVIRSCSKQEKRCWNLNGPPEQHHYSLSPGVNLE